MTGSASSADKAVSAQVISASLGSLIQHWHKARRPLWQRDAWLHCIQSQVHTFCITLQCTRLCDSWLTLPQQKQQKLGSTAQVAGRSRTPSETCLAYCSYLITCVPCYACCVVDMVLTMQYDSVAGQAPHVSVLLLSSVCRGFCTMLSQTCGWQARWCRQCGSRYTNSWL